MDPSIVLKPYSTCCDLQNLSKTTSLGKLNMIWTNKVRFISGVCALLMLDFLDQEWLDSVNAERKKEQIDMVSCETFEIIMDRLEKEWFDLVRLFLLFFFRSR
jgi:hypothetical protein